MNFRERLERDRHNRMPANDNNPLDERVESDYFGIGNVANPPACVDLRFADGNRVAIPYSYVTEIKFEPAQIEMLTNNKIVKITGRDLEKLYDYLAAFRVRFIKVHEGEDFEEDGLCVTGIEVEG